MEYCEQLIASGRFEPLNAITSMAFLVTAWRAHGALCVCRGGPAAAERLLAACTVAIGLGSFLWHGARSALTASMDIVPIVAFVFIYLAAAMRVFFAARGTAVTLAGLGLAGALGVAVTFGATALNGSMAYVPVWVALLGLALAVRRRNRHAGRRLLAAAGLFAMSLAARSVDLAACTVVPAGTHWVWHLANAGVIYLLITVLGRARAMRGPSAIGPV